MTRRLLERDVSPNPYDDVPEGLAKRLEAYVLSAKQDDLHGSPGRMDALNVLFEVLDEIFDEPHLRSKWKTAHRNRAFRVRLGERGELFETSLAGHDDGRDVEIPADLIDLLITDVLELGRQARYAKLAATRHLVVGDWFDLALDGEKLLGHLLRVHSVSSEWISRGDEDLWAEHGKLHARARAGSATKWLEMTAAHAAGLHS